MKITKLLAGSLAAVALGVGFTACSDDAPDSGKNNVVDRDQVRYLSIALNNPGAPSSRTIDGPFDDGSADESAINTLIFVFYDSQGNPTAQMKTLNASDGTVSDDFDDDNVTRFWQKVVPVEMTQGQNTPAYVMCFVNPINPNNLATMTLSEVEVQERTRIKNGGLFAMSNSVYYGDDPISGNKNVRMMATPILDGQLYGSPKEAEAAAGEGAFLDIYVERYAAKIGLNLKPEKIDDYPVNVMGENGSSTLGAIKFTPAYWRPNAIDEHTYITKAFSNGQDPIDPTNPATFAEMNDLFNSSTGMFNSWNAPTYYRSYWACSPSYYAGAYPNVSDNITDNADWETNFPYDLRYFTYEQIVKGIDGDVPADKGIQWDATNGFATNLGNSYTASSGYFYSRETTAQIANITSKEMNNKAVVASAVIVGNYALTTATGDPTTFYLYGMANGRPNYYGDLDLLLEVMVNNQVVIYSNQEGTTLSRNNDLFNIEHPSKDVRGDENVAGRLVTLQIAPEKLADETNAVYFNDGTDFVKITTENLAAANRLLWKTVSTAQMFKNGLAFFSIPIRHLGFGVEVDENKPLISKDYNQYSNVYQWQNMRPGDFGVVRNHVYTLNIQSISGLGTGLRDEQQPIVPPMDPDNYFVKARLNVLSWRVVPAQGVIL